MPTTRRAKQAAKKDSHGILAKGIADPSEPDLKGSDHGGLQESKVYLGIWRGLPATSHDQRSTTYELRDLKDNQQSPGLYRGRQDRC